MHFIRLRHLTVDFPIYQGSSRSLKKLLFATSTQGNLARDAFDRINVRALNDLTVEIRDGDRVGLIGGNGAGKTTLLKVMARIYHPTGGEIAVSGRISALLDASVGFNPEATGRENIILRGMHMDIHPRQMRTRIEEIAAFTELGPYLDMPVRTYSAGMMVRLGFAVSTCVPPEILLMDEWLAAGDAKFLNKAQKRMEEFVSGSNIVVLASHSLPLLQQWCTRAILLDRGRMIGIGPVDEMIAAYQASLLEPEDASDRMPRATKADAEPQPSQLTWEAYQNRGIKRSEAGDYLGAAEDFDKAIRISPVNTALHFLRGVALMKGGNPEAARAEFEKGLELEPANLTLTQLLKQVREATEVN